LTIAIFFLVLARSMKRVELRPWLYAWLANLGALAVTVIFWYANPRTPLVFAVIRFGYMVSKTAFVVLLAFGVRAMNRRAMLLVFAGCLAGAIVIPTLDWMGFVMSVDIALVLGAGAILLLLDRRPGFGWLAAGFAVRTILAISEALAHGSRIFPNPWRASKAVDFFLAAYSSFDTGAEWIIVLGCVLILYRTTQQELVQSNADLIGAYSALQELADRDPLTGLLNRRALPAVLRKSFGTGATIVFFDLNDFKLINDSYGHQAGDDALKHFARALEASFRPDDHIIRHSGDEFVVVVPGVEPPAVLARLDQVRERLRFERGSGPPIAFSAGHAYLAVNGEPEAALRAADEAMYRDKAAKQRVRFR
jgi:diguanylate cyclase (GGDEF)-like protein